MVINNTRTKYKRNNLETPLLLIYLPSCTTYQKNTNIKNIIMKFFYKNIIKGFQ